MTRGIAVASGSTVYATPQMTFDDLFPHLLTDGYGGQKIDFRRLLRAEFPFLQLSDAGRVQAELPLCTDDGGVPFVPAVEGNPNEVDPALATDLRADLRKGAALRRISGRHWTEEEGSRCVAARRARCPARNTARAASPALVTVEHE